MQKEVGNKTLGGYLRKIDLLCEELKLSYQVEKDGKEYAVNIFRGYVRIRVTSFTKQAKSLVFVYKLVFLS
ncbi:hypothetical protein [Piscirickettsia litoralis]|uniref:Uncharacterized protein n=1 Tax=Piscirickettsia litoralis TaxID=1891921 RepID=A0ABX2ZX16_9GAMM|nr:hypothetical protein [Piscirickettsia litoralis]ODN41141.1 hypothetical protein BGC07_17865 [Piscirickettsia litoralis]